MADEHDIRIYGAAADLDLQDLNNWIRKREQALAPVIAIGRGENAKGEPETAVSFDLDQDTLDKKKVATLRLQVGGQAVVGPDETLVCKGKVYLSGTLTPAYLVRPKV